MQICAINSGYWDTKAYEGRKLFKFRTKMDMAQNSIINSVNTSRIICDGQEYIIGDGAEKYTLEYDKTNSLIHKLATYYALSKYTELREEYRVMVALPLNVYSTLRVQYESYLRSRDYVQLTVDGVKKHIWLQDVKCFPEGPAALYANDPQRYRDEPIGILDIGSLTVNGCIMQNLNLVKESIFTVNAGTIILYSKLQRELNSRYLTNLREYQMQQIVSHGMKGSDELIRETITFHLQEIILEMRKKNWPVESIRILLTGGGSVLLQEYLSKMLPGSFLGQDPVYDNVKGLYEIAKVVYT
jgi:hypothetical protein